MMGSGRKKGGGGAGGRGGVVILHGLEPCCTRRGGELCLSLTGFGASGCLSASCWRSAVRKRPNLIRRRFSLWLAGGGWQWQATGGGWLWGVRRFRRPALAPEFFLGGGSSGSFQPVVGGCLLCACGPGWLANLHYHTQ